MVAMYPVAYRSAAAVLAGGVRGAPGGVIGFAAGAALTAIYVAYELSKRDAIVPPQLDVKEEPKTVAQAIAQAQFGSIPGGWPAYLHGWVPELPGHVGRGPNPYGLYWAKFQSHNHTIYHSQAGGWAAWGAGVNPDIAQDFHLASGALWTPEHGGSRACTYVIFTHEATGDDDLLNEPEVFGKTSAEIFGSGTAAKLVPIPNAIPHSSAASPTSQRGYSLPLLTAAQPVRQQDRTTRLGAGITLNTVQSTSAARAVPAANVVEQKLHIRMFGLPAGIEFIGALFELLDLVDAIYKGLIVGYPKQPFRNSIDKLEFILANWRDIDWKVVAFAIEDQMEDFAIGLQGQALAGMGAAVGLPFGLGTIGRAGGLPRGN